MELKKSTQKIKDRKAKLEEDILSLVKNFEEETGLMVAYITPMHTATRNLVEKTRKINIEIHI